MEIQLTAKHIKITAAIDDYVRQKIQKAQKYFDQIVWGQAFLSVEKRTHNAEFVIHAPKQTFRALAAASDLYSAIDLASDKIDAQLKKFKERIKDRHKNSREAELPDAQGAETRQALKISIVKQPIFPMTAEEAVDEMESLGQAFRLYEDRDSGQIQIVYRGSDESYKILQPVKKRGR